MKLFRSARFALALVVCSAAPLAAQQAPPLPKPGPEHEVFKMDVGTWNAVVEFSMAQARRLRLRRGSR